MWWLPPLSTPSPSAAASTTPEAKKNKEHMSKSLHGGNIFAIGVDENFVTPRQGTNSPTLAAGKEWTVHDGQSFARAIFEQRPRGPQERLFLANSFYEDLFPRDADGQRHFQDQIRGLDFTSSKIRRQARRDEVVGTSPAPPHLRMRPAAFSSTHAREGGGASCAVAPPLSTPVSRAALKARAEASVARRRWEEFHVTTLLGRGRFSVVRRATRRCDGADCAIKVTLVSPCRAPDASTASGSSIDSSAAEAAPLPLASDTDEALEDDVECFLRELHLLQDVRHPSIVGYHGHGTLQTQDGAEYGFVVLDLLDGVDLRRHLSAGLSPHCVVRWAWQLAAVLAFLHARRIIHRDVKASNVIITSASDLKLIDFGLALRFDDGDEPPGGARNDAPPLLTQYQATRRVGVFGYMAPEVWRCAPYGTAVDIFAFGAVLHRMLCAAWPLSCIASFRRSLRHSMWDLLQTQYESLMCRPSVSPRVGPTLTALLASCMHRDPAQRPSANAVLLKLRRAAQAHAVELPAEDAQLL